jgi:hypothetical protein
MVLSVSWDVGLEETFVLKVLLLLRVGNGVDEVAVGNADGVEIVYPRRR